MKKSYIKYLYKSFMIIFIFLCLAGCAGKDKKIVPSIYAPPDFNEEDLVGIWEANGASYGSEMITLSADHKFTQEFSEENPKFQGQTSGSWETQKSDKGCTYIFLYDMKYFYQDLDTANYGNRRNSGVDKGSPLHYWDECSQDVITMPDMVVLLVKQFPGTPRNIILQHMSTTRESTEIWFTLVEENK